VEFAAFENDEELIDAVVHNLTVIGEAVPLPVSSLGALSLAAH